MPNSIDIDKLADLGGHIYDEKNIKEVVATLKYPMMAGANSSIKGSGRGKSINLATYIIKVLGKYPTREQAIGDCVSMGAAGAVDVLKGIAVINKGEEIGGITSSEAIYGLARHEIGRDAWRGGDGASGASGAQACKFGTLVRKKYDKHDLSEYSGDRARIWGDSGLPDELEPISREHNVKTISMVNTYYEAIDSLQNGHVITVASNVGFDNSRDRNGRILRNQDGIIRPAGSWNHQMMFCGYIDDSNPRILCVNSWGNFCAGGPSEMFDGSFYITADVVETMLRQGDSFSLSSFEGFPPQKLNLRLL